MSAVDLRSGEIELIKNALFVAAEEWAKHAHDQGDNARILFEEGDESGSAGCRRLSEQFSRQVAEAKALIEKLEEL